MIIVEDGKVVEFCAEPGLFTYDSSTEPSIFTGNLKDSIKETFKLLGKRFTYGGDTGKDQRVYYFNTKEILDNKFGTANPIPFRVVDESINFRRSLSVRCSGIYSYRIVDPILFYTNVCGNVSGQYERGEIDSQLKTEFISALQPAMAGMSKYNLLPEDLITHNTEVEEEMRIALSKKWAETRGLEVVTVAFGSVTLPEDQQKLLEEAQMEGMYKDPGMATGAMAAAMKDSMKAAASNPNGAMAGFMGLGMSMNQMNNMTGGLAAMYQNAGINGQAQPAAGGWKCSCGATATGNFCPLCGAKKPAPENGWKCACGATATGNFCPECGAKKPAQADANGWTCACGKFNQGKFCAECGAKKPAGIPVYKCDKCGWTPEDPAHPPKFCPECGDIFDDSDITG